MNAPKKRPRVVRDLVACWQAEYGTKWTQAILALYTEYEGGTRVRDIEWDHLHLLAVKLRERRSRARSSNAGKPLSVGTIRNIGGYALKVLQWGHRQGWIKVVPEAPVLPKRMKRPRDVAPEELKKAIEQCPENARLVIRFMLLTGARPSEVVSLRWADVDLGVGRITLVEHKTALKTGTTRNLYLSPAALEILRQVRERVPVASEHVFLGSRGEPWTVRAVAYHLQKHRITPYQLRHTAAQQWLESGVPMEDVAKLLGHRNLQTVQVYAQVRDARLQSVAATLRDPLGV